MNHLSSWRLQAARIVEELFPVSDPEEWDALIDLRQALLEGNDWTGTLDLFLRCRHRLEQANYLPFYRLRRLLALSLRLEIGAEDRCITRHPALFSLLRRRHPSLAHLQRALGREYFESGLDLPDGEGLRLRVVERLPT